MNHMYMKELIVNIIITENNHIPFYLTVFNVMKIVEGDRFVEKYIMNTRSICMYVARVIFRSTPKLIQKFLFELTSFI